MNKPTSVDTLTKLGRVRLSRNFFMRDMLYSEVANYYGLSNVPDNPDLAITVGRKLCNELLEPLQATFGHVSIRSAYRSADVNKYCAEKGHGCAMDNRARHTWDCLEDDRFMGATASIVIPWFVPRFEVGTPWQAMAWWIHDHLPAYSELCFYPVYAAFNIRWRGNAKSERTEPEHLIKSHAKPRGVLTRPGMDNHSGNHSSEYPGFPELRHY